MADVQASEAVALFVARSGAILSDFGLTADNALIVGDVCRRLAGLPLAIELVAAQIASLGLNQIAARLDAGFALGLSGPHGAPARQQTLRATLDWSYALLDDEERLVFRRLAVFVGGWTLRAAEAVCGDDALPTDNVADVLERLVAKSLVQVDQQPDSVRYHYLETVRSYALEHLSASGAGPLIQQRHAAYMLTLAELVPPGAADSASDHPVLQTALVTAEPPRWANARLTSRERQVIQLLAQGLSTRQIGTQLAISPGTVRSHLDHVMAKFDLHSRVQVVAWATQT